MASVAVMKSKSAIECLHYALSLPTSTVITGMETMERLDQALEAFRTFQPMSADAVSALLARTQQAADTGEFERFKTGTEYDATARNLDWLG